MCVLEEVRERMEMGREKYGHGVRVDDDTRTWGTRNNSWLNMAREEFLDAIVYVTADYIRHVRKEDRSFRNSVEDDNELIMSIIKDFSTVESSKHKMLLWNLKMICEKI